MEVEGFDNVSYNILGWNVLNPQVFQILFQTVFPESLFVPTQDLLILEMPRKHEFTGPSYFQCADDDNDVVEVFSFKHICSLPVGGFLPNKESGRHDWQPRPGLGAHPVSFCVCHVSGVALLYLSNASTSGSRVSYFSKFDMVVLLLDIHDNTIWEYIVGLFLGFFWKDFTYVFDSKKYGCAFVLVEG